jgi:2-amino-4-hydroxy-6-hydroxymethyldihydropteridine diphosphokinase
VRLAYLSLGSNVGDRGAYLAGAIHTLSRHDEYRLSSVYETEPVGGVAQDNFWNLVMELATRESARDLLELAHRAEEDAQRSREVRWGPRTLDVDIVLVGGESLNLPELTVPHPRMYERSFVLVPLAELAPNLVSEDQLAAATGRVVKLGTLSSLR